MTNTEPFSDPPGPLELVFWQFHQENPHVYALFKRFCFQAINAGRTRLSACMIYERIRWETQIDTTTYAEGSYKLSNNHRTYYARLFAREFPDYKDYFVMKAIGHERDKDDEYGYGSEEPIE